MRSVLPGVPITDGAAEVVLAVLISNFTFELTDKPIYWNMAGVQYPSTDERGERPELPMKVDLVKRGSVRALQSQRVHVCGLNL